MKVVYNRRPGRFGVSVEALLYLLQESEFPLSQALLFKSEHKESEFEASDDKGVRIHHSEDKVLLNGFVYSFPEFGHTILRDHPALVTIVEQLGPRANGKDADLAIAEIELKERQVYRIRLEEGGAEDVCIDTPLYSCDFPNDPSGWSFYGLNAPKGVTRKKRLK